MKKLRKKIVLYFILCAFVLQVAGSALDSSFELILPYIKSISEGIAASAVVTLLVINAILFVIAAFIFFTLVKKAVASESQRQTEEQSLMYASLAHDLKTPLTSVVGFSSSLLDRKIPAEKQNEVLETIHSKAVQMNVLLESMLSYSKLGAASFELNREKVDFCSFIKNIAADYYNDFESHGMNLDIEMQEHKMYAMVDRRELSRAVGNLLSNAISHNGDGTRVLIRVTEEKKCAILTVADTGRQIDRQDAEKLFSPFVSGDRARTSGRNSGLGLAISRKTVLLHGGRLYIDFDIPNYTKAFIMEVPKCKER
ncbi:MAG: HAMP domain-containing histidine kinase [Treponema sp.]|nr:HAMP domain-containing histidine kinase [Treponema sp.]MBQ6566774.1 HAMP domain-containing histidine kinase [Treponema sp.]